MRYDVTIYCDLLLPEPMPRMITVIVEAGVFTNITCNSIGEFQIKCCDAEGFTEEK